ncbi:TetR/AcrR family transcriptional regulator [Frankia sp. CcI49]|uniref:TetR/AcrR family transcriptional regulator n=1 Tax=Frankia sp. CcI49 TaxID=1745382 RepID=UPI001054B07E|nr:TetR/AcrR family transcriptional regulator [Frankia sp. CcI49]
MTKATPREERRKLIAALTRDQLLDAAERLFGQRGYRETNLKQVTDTCGLSVGALYLHFDSKEALLRAVIDRRSVVIMAQVRSFIEADGPAIDRLLDLVMAEIEFFRAHRDFGRVIDRLYAAGFPTLPELRVDIAHGYTTAMQLEAELIRAGQRDATIRAGDADVLARILGSMVGAYRADDAAREEGDITGPGMHDADFVDIVRGAFAATTFPRRQAQR